MGWMPLVLIAILALATVGVVLLVRAWPRSASFSPQERRELAEAPMAPLQKRAWLGLAISGGTLLIIAAILHSTGAAAYWEDDALRLRVVGIFIAGLLAYVVGPLLLMVKSGMSGAVDERDRAILARASTMQSTLVLLALAAWMISLGEMFREPGAVPMVYLYLMFGSVVLVNLVGQSAGILFGYWIGVGLGER